MNKYIISILVIASAMTISAVSAESGTTSTGTTSTGTTATGTTSTGTTNTGTTTGTGIKCTTASGVTQADNQAALLAAQQAFSAEIARLVSVKQAAYSGTQTLTGTARVEALKTANVAFRTGFQATLKTLSIVKRDKRSNHQEIRECRVEKKEVKKEEKEDKKEHKEEVKSQVKALKDRIKELKVKREDSRGQSTGRR
jgi:hypothetical protein